MDVYRIDEEQELMANLQKLIHLDLEITFVIALVVQNFMVMGHPFLLVNHSQAVSPFQDYQIVLEMGLPCPLVIIIMDKLMILEVP